MTGLWLAVAGAADATEERFMLLSAETPERLERRLVELGDAGYRLLGAATGVSAGGADRIAVLLESTAGSTDFDHAVVACDGRLESAGGPGIAHYASAGYRLLPAGVVVRRMEDFWLPESSYDDQMVLILERSSGLSASYHYESVAFGSFERFHRSLADKQAGGFTLLGVWNSGRRLQALLERSSTAEPPPVPSGTSYRLLIQATRSGLRRAVRRAAGDGFRVVAAADPSIAGPPIVLLGKTGVPADDVTYRFVADVPKKLHKDKL
ncbi:MAG TPA: hypothetical protein VD788_08455, partial [Candidatus Polarisedimenticolaceae bacterium]|nr:hypothetical protein [Candidatus Polarisedimenticolaceae bacterium]